MPYSTLNGKKKRNKTYYIEPGFAFDIDANDGFVSIIKQCRIIHNNSGANYYRQIKWKMVIYLWLKKKHVLL